MWSCQPENIIAMEKCGNENKHVSTYPMEKSTAIIAASIVTILQSIADLELLFKRLV